MPFNYAYNNLLHAIDRFSLLNGSERILVGFSGGADSTLLLTLLNSIEGLEIAAAHLNHGIRGDEAKRDEDFCREYCEKLGVRIFLSHSNVPELAKMTGKSLEEAARDARYSFFEKISEENGYSLIATAHNADDSLETAIFHLARGSSVDGLCGIPPKRGNLIRPLILLSKDEIVSALEDRGIPYVTDSTNLSNEYTRNMIRHTVIPQLKKINPSIIKTFTASSDNIRRDYEYLSCVSSKYSFSDGRAALSALHDAILSRVIINELHKFGCKPEKKHVDALIHAIRSSDVHTSLSLPALDAVCDRDFIYLKAKNTKSDDSFCFPLKIGLNKLPNGRILYIGNNEKDIISLKNIYKLSIHRTVSSAKIYSECFVRSRLEGDTIRLGGMTRKVKKLIQSLKLRSSYTDGIPFIECNGELIFVPHFPVSDIAVPNCVEDTTDIYYFYNL